MTARELPSPVTMHDNVGSRNRHPSVSLSHKEAWGGEVEPSDDEPDVADADIAIDDNPTTAIDDTTTTGDDTTSDAHDAADAVSTDDSTDDGADASETPKSDRRVPPPA